jgi:hypothetical protein
VVGSLIGGCWLVERIDGRTVVKLIFGYVGSGLGIFGAVALSCGPLKSSLVVGGRWFWVDRALPQWFCGNDRMLPR